MEKQKCPELRFSQYKNDWYETTLGDVVDIVGGGTPDTNVPEFWNGDIDWYSPTEIGESVYANGSIKKITVSGLKNSSAKILPAKKTVLFSSRAGIGDMAILDKPAATNQGFQSFVANNIDVYFLYSMGVKIKKFALSKASGSTFLEISRNQLAQMEFLAPSIDSNEQIQIGNFFQNLDQSIALQEKKLTQTQNLKKAMLEKMFPKAGSTQPEIRLKGFSGDWEAFGLFDVALYKNGKSHESDVVVKGKYIIVNSKFISTDGVVRKFCDSQIEPLLKNDIVFVLSDVPNGKALSKSFLIDVDGKYTLNQRIACLTPDEQTDAYFLYVLINRNPYFLKFDDGVGQTNLSLADMENFIALYPCAEEQKTIGQFFKQLDETLVLQQQQLQTLKNLKQAFLEKMFV
ncbi:MAG: restriction endonuclease subunit S [Acinetobacter sp.]